MGRLPKRKANEFTWNVATLPAHTSSPGLAQTRSIPSGPVPTARSPATESGRQRKASKAATHTSPLAPLAAIVAAACQGLSKTVESTGLARPVQGAPSFLPPRPDASWDEVVCSKVAMRARSKRRVPCAPRRTVYCPILHPPRRATRRGTLSRTPQQLHGAPLLALASRHRLKLPSKPALDFELRWRA